MTFVEDPRNSAFISNPVHFGNKSRERLLIKVGFKPRVSLIRSKPLRTWFNWNRNEPNGGNPGISVAHIWPWQTWNDITHTAELKVICTFRLPAGAENTCPWLRDFE